nr:ABC transporter permease [Polyangiaceae bacterium]
MDYALVLASRYLRSKKREFVSVGTLFASLGVALGVAALAIVMSVTGAFKDQFREKVLGVNAHVLVLKYAIDFREYREVMEKVGKLPHVIGISPFIINPMMVTHGTRTATGVLLKGMDPVRMPSVLDLPKHVREGTLEGIRRPESKPAERRIQDYSNPLTAPQPPGVVGSANPREQEFKDNALLEEIRKSVERDRQERPIPSQGENGAEPEKGEGVVGEVTPKGGFKSELPEDDPLIDAVLPTSCG